MLFFAVITTQDTFFVILSISCFIQLCVEICLERNLFDSRILTSGLGWFVGFEFFGFIIFYSMSAGLKFSSTDQTVMEIMPNMSLGIVATKLGLASLMQFTFSKYFTRQDQKLEE